MNVVKLKTLDILLCFKTVLLYIVRPFFKCMAL